MAVIAASIVLDTDGAAWYSGPPDPTTFQQSNAKHVYINVDGTSTGWKEAIGVFVNTDGATTWATVAPPSPATVTATDGTVCSGSPSLPVYRIAETVTNVASDVVATDSRFWRSTSGNSGFVAGDGSFTLSEGDTGTCWGYWEVRVKGQYSDWGPWQASNHFHLPRHPCSRPS